MITDGPVASHTSAGSRDSPPRTQCLSKGRLWFPPTLGPRSCDWATRIWIRVGSGGVGLELDQKLYDRIIR
jgi:hypothetical protein